MKTHLTVLLLVALLVSLPDRAISLAAQQENPKEEPDEQAPPTLALSVNNADEAVVKAGAPLLMEVVVGPADGRDAEKPISLKGSTGGWGSLVSLEIKDARGKPMATPGAKRANSTEASITLDPNTMGQLVWTLECEPGKELAPGEYSITATLDSSRSAESGWQGKTVSPPAKLVVKASALSEDEARLAALAEVQIKSFQAQPEEALAAADRFLSGKANDPLILEAKGDVLAKQGKFREALDAYKAVLVQLKPQEESPLREPPINVLRKIQMATEALKHR